MISIALAGGAGTRFWPASRREHPKQLLEIWDDKPMIESTVDRLAEYTDRDKILVVAGPHLIDSLRDALPQLPPRNFIVEPAPRDTAPAIALGALHARRRFGDEPVGLFPADHYISDTDALCRCLSRAERTASEGSIVTLGIDPTRPETGYGYIRYDAEKPRTENSPPVYGVDEFVEKPDRATALEYLESGNYAWNSGMFVFEPSVLFEEFERQLPQTYTAMQKIRRQLAESEEFDESVFTDIDPISIDYGIMEGADDIAVIPATFGWSDVGHWAALDEIQNPDENQNICLADVVSLESHESIFFSDDPEHVIGAVGLEDKVVVHTEDATLVADRSRSQSVKQLVEVLERQGYDQLL